VDLVGDSYLMTNYQRESVIECEGLIQAHYKARNFVKLEPAKNARTGFSADKMADALKPVRVWFASSKAYVCQASDGDYYRTSD
jgi:hypothetical protein